MLFSQATSFVLFFLSIGSAVASPTPDDSAIEARQDADVLSVLTTLQGQNSGTLAQITNLVNSGGASDATITPLISELAASFSGATASLGALPPSRRHLKRDVVADVALLLSVIIKDLTTTLSLLLSVKTIVALDVLLVTVDTALQKLLVSVNILVVGVVVALQELLVSVSGILVSLGFTLTLLLLGLGL